MRTPTEIRSAFDRTEALAEGAPFYLVGIGGAGMSGLARILANRRLDVRGSDSTPSTMTAELEARGIGVRIGHSGEDIRPGDQVVVSDAIPLEDSPEVRAARELGCKMFRRSQLLGWLVHGKKIIAVTGTHGKTTVTGMIGAGLRAAGMDPTIVVGAEVPEFGGAAVEGKGEFAVIEACEAYDGFHDLDPFLIVLTNLEADHLDYHGSFENLKASMASFVGHLPPDGELIFCQDDQGAHEIADDSSVRKTAYEFGTWKRLLKDTSMPSLTPQRIGKHNVSNAGAALSACMEVGAGAMEAALGIASYEGAERRLQQLQPKPPKVEFHSEEGAGWKVSEPERADVTVIDDYAHHPTEVEASLTAIRENYVEAVGKKTGKKGAPTKRLIVVFQPHLYSRTAAHLSGFARALSIADEIVITDIYPAREEPMPGISSSRIAELIERPVHYVPSRHLLPRYVAKLTRPGDVVAGMGAGNIAEFAPALIEELKRIGGSGATKPSDWGRRIRVAVLFGGDSAEREVSILSGREVHQALETKGFQSIPIDITNLLLSRGELHAFVGATRPDVAFLTVHGTNAEDGAIQGLLELLHIPYTGSGVQSSAIAMDKQLTKQVLAVLGLPVPNGRLVWSAEEPIDLKAPLVVKPNAQGSTVGVTFVRKDAELEGAIKKALIYGSGALVEEWIEGTEVSVPVLGERALPAVEIVPKKGAYDFANKYTPGATEEICPARLPEEMLKKLEEMALKAHSALGCKGATRTDMMVRGEEIFLLEINTIPGMTRTSLLPNSARVDGISFEDLCEWMVKDALGCHAEKA